MAEVQKLTPKDFKSDQEIRWCAGCGDHAILNAVQKTMANLNLPKEKYAVVSGIGCSSRFPYYMNTYGFHGIHGRGAAIASGLKVANPELSVWQITGDGDAMAIGGNHFIHVIRRNIDMNLLLFNNEIYGLTKGQYSPTSRLGAKSKTSPFGTIEHPFHPGELVIGAQGHFFARAIDVQVKVTTEILDEAARFKGTSVVEILQNCVIFNDGIHEEVIGKNVREDRTIHLKHGEKILFGKEMNKGLIRDGLKMKVVTVGEDGYTLEDILTHDAYETNPGMHLMLANMKYPEFPVAIGIIRAVKSPTYEERLVKQIEEVQSESKIKCMDDLLNSGDTWEI
ncbi:MAG: 2-oxoacid:ferredoxin oxidoreductase subunit beta [Salinivirgaceae bacterium]|jgi:2-oxoglutarate ferredoxin oxidoreductase subunit beta|nr:2-oxoacid:ferredoxin oxidoreductase subunit beta [Salinivirgaceae bacterium]